MGSCLMLSIGFPCLPGLISDAQLARHKVGLSGGHVTASSCPLKESRDIPPTSCIQSLYSVRPSSCAVSSEKPSCYSGPRGTVRNPQALSPQVLRSVHLSSVTLAKCQKAESQSPISCWSLPPHPCPGVDSGLHGQEEFYDFSVWRHFSC